MVEEAAGTRMFEDRKDKAIKTMAKKEKRVTEIASLLHEEIIPKLDKLRQEKKQFLDWQKACTELERIGRVLRAWEWTENNERVVRKEEEMQQKKREVVKLQKDKERFLKEAESAENQAKKVQAEKDKELKKGGKLKKMEDDVAELDKELTKIRTQVEIQEKSITEEEDKAAEARDALNQVRLLLTSYNRLELISSCIAGEGHGCEEG